ncbi:nucleotidyl transferase AbiEii/AbiGii toxin family protein [Tetragenococcus halophilus]|uniref:nucleotidyl transferase AbiEii/AbiGii toxin family protein n=1 Tax=Tetragenococcus halophilus TaxID=51669 RepID=UPI0025617C53|nr:nucleotidyl transferase AbiEii/AbiGii toxin family protein [Tetragenococcus halophilus]GMG69291.1 hypothetical protein TEHMS4_22290 [Tetragenococcus halophilus]
MINEESLTTSWYNKLTQDDKNLDRTLLDKVTHALYLLEKLTDTNLNFIFKGGTSLLLLLKEMKRLSIDIDIIITEKMTKQELSDTLEELINRSSFTRFEEQVRNKTSIPKAHFKFFYDSPLGGTEAYVLLDVLFANSPYNNLLTLPIESPFINTSPPNKTVTIPDIENILGDKLTAFAPNITGIPYGKGKEMEIIKQLFDIESLFDQAVHLPEINKSFIESAKQELSYRQLIDSTKPIDVLDDILKTTCIIGGRGNHEKETFLLLEDGIRRIKTHIIKRNYIVEEAVVSAAKVAYLVSLMQTGATTIERFEPSKPLPELVGNPLFKKMAKIKKFSSELKLESSKIQFIP